MLPLVKLPGKVSTQPFVHPYQTLDRIGHRCLHAVLPRLSRGISLHELAGWLLLRMRILFQISARFFAAGSCPQNGSVSPRRTPRSRLKAKVSAIGAARGIFALSFEHPLPQLAAHLLALKALHVAASG